MKSKNQKRVENIINQAKDLEIAKNLEISEDDKYLLDRYADIFENASDTAIYMTLGMIHTYRATQGFHKKMKKNTKKSIPGLKKEASRCAAILIEILSYKGLMTKKANHLIEELNNLVDEPEKYFPIIGPSSKNDLREFFQNEAFYGHRVDAKKFVDSL